MMACSWDCVIFHRADTAVLQLRFRLPVTVSRMRPIGDFVAQFVAFSHPTGQLLLDVPDYLLSGVVYSAVGGMILARVDRSAKLCGICR